MNANRLSIRSQGRGRARRRCRRRGGFTLAELALSIILLLAGMSVTMKMVAWVGAERRAADRRQWALHELSNTLEHLAAEPFDRLTAERARAALAETPVAKSLPGAEWDASVALETGAPVPSKRVSVRIRWKDRSGNWDAPVALTSWVYGRRNPS